MANTSIRKMKGKTSKCDVLLGQVKDFLAKKVFDYCDADPEKWAVISRNGVAHFYDSEAQALESAKKVAAGDRILL